MDWANDLAILAKILLAVVLGGLVGFEREMADRPAGLRTHMLVAAAAALLMSLGDVLMARYTGINVRSDPLRLFEAILVGVSFLGAGTIFRAREGGAVQGLTTAASLWFTAVLGMGVALEQYALTVGATLLLLLINYGVRRVLLRRE